MFPDHWSFLLGEVALYAFIVLIATGIYLALFFEPSLADDRLPRALRSRCRARTMSAGLPLGREHLFNVTAGLLIRQTHHWAADVFVAAIVLHLMRIFFTGAFRKPRELTYLIGLTMLFLVAARGLPRLLAGRRPAVGMGLAIGYGVALSLPLDRRQLALLIWGAPFPGDRRVRVAAVHRARVR